MKAIILLSDNSLYNSLCHASTDETIPIDIELFLLYLDKNALSLRTIRHIRHSLIFTTRIYKLGIIIIYSQSINLKLSKILLATSSIASFPLDTSSRIMSDTAWPYILNDQTNQEFYEYACYYSP